ncbi:MAG: DNA internalization-related competence protein ComEC/Rec2 [Candidatus Margulisiibacteriota bacterium]
MLPKAPLKPLIALCLNGIKRWFTPLLLAAVVAVIVALSPWLEKPVPLPDAPLNMTVTLSALPKPSQAVARSPFGTVILNFKTPFLAMPGDTFRVSGRFRLLREPTNPGEFNAPHYYRVKGINGVFLVTHTQKLGQGSWWNPNRVLFVLHNRVLALHDRYLGPQLGPLLSSFLIGDQGLHLPDELQTIYQKTGLTHLLVVSGAQVSLLCGSCLVLLRLLPLSNPVLVVVMTVIHALFYGLTGGGTSIFRAVLMSEIALILALLNRRTHPLHLLSFTALLMLAWNPLFCFDLGFLLSFAATASLVFGVPLLEAGFPTTWPQWLKTLVAMTLAPFLFTTPITWYAFQTLSPIALVTNALVVPISEVVVLAGFLGSGIGLLMPSVGAPFLVGCGQVLSHLNGVLAKISQIPGGNFALAQPWLGWLVLFYAGLGWAVLRHSQRKPGTSVGLSLMTIALLGIAIPTWFPSSTLTVTFLDVGQGDATVIETPSHRSFLIDGGPRVKDFLTGKIVFDAGQRIVAPFLRYEGITALDGILLTHFHDDHFGGLFFLLPTYSPKVFVTNGEPNPHLPVPKTTTTLAAVQNQVFRLEKGIVLRILYPEPDHVMDENENNNSVVTKLTMGTVDILFMGDLEEEGENALLANQAPALGARVLKLGHHGSKTSSTEAFLAAVHPQIAIASAGRNNKFRHPSQEVVERLSEHQIRLYRTDKNGAIQLLTDGKRISLSTYLPNGF